MNTTCDYPLAGLSVKLRHETHAAETLLSEKNTAINKKLVTAGGCLCMIPYTEVTVYIQRKWRGRGEGEKKNI